MVPEACRLTLRGRLGRGALALALLAFGWMGPHSAVLLRVLALYPLAVATLGWSPFCVLWRGLHNHPIGP